MFYEPRIKEWNDPRSGEVNRRWMKRARLVARGYASQRRRVWESGASSHLPGLGVEGVRREELQIGGLDVKDVFLMANQEERVQITTKNCRFKAAKKLPGPRFAVKVSYEFLATFLEKRGAEFTKENLCLRKRNGCCFILLHVDDLMFCGLNDEDENLVHELTT